jgi:hypothetical protein
LRASARRARFDWIFSREDLCEPVKNDMKVFALRKCGVGN